MSHTYLYDVKANVCSNYKVNMEVQENTKLLYNMTSLQVLYIYILL